MELLSIVMCFNHEKLGLIVLEVVCEALVLIILWEIEPENSGWSDEVV